jgi:uncharacterized protein YqjF (DUF2071 family)
MGTADAGSLPLRNRLDARRRPAGVPIVHQRWHDLAFLHWPVSPQALRPLVPDALALDLFDGQAWIGVTPFRLTNLRPTGLPALPGVSQAHEINVRVYVQRDGVPGIWFPSLEITNRLALWGARIAYGLPYFHARMHLARAGDTVEFTSERTAADAAPARFEARWQLGEPLAATLPGTLDDFLIERYVLYCRRGGDLLRARIHHRPWPLRAARVLHFASSLLEADGLPATGPPLLAHAQAEPFDVEVWPPSHA